MMEGVEQRPHIEALELFADLLARVEGEPDSSVFYGQMCDAICRLTSMERAVIFRYDERRRRVLAVGAHGLDLGLLRDLHVTVESVPLARQALEQDRVTEAARASSASCPTPGATRSRAATSSSPRSPRRAAGSASSSRTARAPRPRSERRSGT
jgi:hypothetical protein